MQPELNLQHTTKPELLPLPALDSKEGRIRDIAKTLLVVVCVCFAMPFMTVTVGDSSATLSIYQIGSALQKTDIIKMLPEETRSIVILVRIAAWAIMVIGAAALILVLTRYRSSQYQSIMAFCFAGFIASIGMAAYLFFILRANLDQAVSFRMGAGGACIVAGFLLAAMVFLTTRIQKRTLMAGILILFVIPATILFGIFFLGDRKYYFISLMIVIETMIPFFMVFENRKPEAREIIVIAVMAAIGVAGRAAFFMLPAFKPLLAIVIICGVAMGAEAGFLCGALAAFVSGFLFGQGPWTPWQMFSFGIVGFLAGLLSQKGWLPAKRIPLMIFGYLSVQILCGFLLDVSAFMMSAQHSWEFFLAILLSGLPFNAVHGLATIFFLFILAKPMLEKLDRIKTKYGLLEP